ncbi:MAG TPA: c-type cytochrome [Rubricoccaceae bacterium]|nr:c-type cytochrome [Rubricoccaceae bacterium]
MRAVLFTLTLFALAACDDGAERMAAQMTGGSPSRGRVLIQQVGCGSCHTIPGVPGAAARVGPPLAGIAGRTYLAGRLENTPSNMLRWLLTPQAVDSLTAMPSVGLTEAQARDVAAYLYTLRQP